MNKKRCSFKHREVGAREGLKIGADADRGHERPKIKRRIERLVFCSERTTWTCAMSTAQVFVCLVPSREPSDVGVQLRICPGYAALHLPHHKPSETSHQRITASQIILIVLCCFKPSNPSCRSAIR